MEFQDPELESRYEATDYDHGYSHPNYEEVVKAYGISYYKIINNNEFEVIDEVLKQTGSVVCEVMVDPDFRVEFPKQKPDAKLDLESAKVDLLF